MPTLSEIAALLGRPVLGDGSVRFARAAEPGRAGPDDLALAMSPAYGDALRDGRARAAILWEGADWESFGLEGAVTVPRARLAMAGITRALDAGPDWGAGVHPAATVDPSASLGEGAVVGAGAVIGPRARIGRNARIGPLAVVEADARIGDDAFLHPHVSIGARCRIGDRFIAQAGARVGGDGFSFVTPEESGVERARRTLGDRGAVGEQHWTRIHSLGAVEIGDDVELGANCTIDRGTVADTRIGRGTKIDNLVMLGHNVQVGEDCLLCAHVGVAGSTRIGDRVVLAGKVGVNDNIEIGDDVVAGGGSNIFTRVPAGKVILGSPAIDMDKRMAADRAVRRLPRMAEQLSQLREAVAKLGRSDG
ncbi:UDP-3-O-(3-hydroxymyristoyl)glucosamine N-acyltransferase [Jannaschia sp. W003]|uniref:UDP-3-O-(3-hydroxymyristoyl)glucosamine N-acyltransferase n=1 Tax=Jannaschia sp. W003 TaxID=2867012 RepID=UPI0021A58C23|nr:UDP-3-O-(3-hydroxymyristoyl)glucosamine N-acyltransferase [Jannaschia sp. W003]UWQ20258.1 UDP-3-O-(3-hydroxymyristoyl)glucosamine N-acyltransferase [Jannaschia sp. W003]